MARLEAKDRQFEPQEIVTRDGEDEVTYTVAISQRNKMRLISAVVVETDLESGVQTTAVDVLKAGEVGLDCVIGWAGVTRDGEPVDWERELFGALPERHIWAFFQAWRIWAMTGEFPLLVLPDRNIRPTETAHGLEARATEAACAALGAGDSLQDESAGGGEG